MTTMLTATGESGRRAPPRIMPGWLLTSTPIRSGDCHRRPARLHRPPGPNRTRLNPASPRPPRRPAAHEPPLPARNRPPRLPGHITTIHARPRPTANRPDQASRSPGRRAVIKSSWRRWRLTFLFGARRSPMARWY
jgi:hypothetical protein